jgi:uncharacterized protein (DUF58 family)
VFSLVACTVARRRLTFRLDSESKTVPKGLPIRLDVTVTNGTFLPIPNVTLRFEYSNSLDGVVHTMTVSVPSAPRSTDTVTFKLDSQYCGVVDVVLSETKVYDNLRMFCLRRRHRQECSTLVTPRVHELPLVVENVSDEVLESDTFSKVKPGDDCSEVFDVREYREGDRVNRVHWKLSSKGSETYVKEYSLPVSDAVLLVPEVVDRGDGETISDMDTVVELVLSLSHALDGCGVRHRMFLYRGGDSSVERITSYEETHTAIGRMVRYGIPEESEPYALRYLRAVDDVVGYSHTVYVTNVLDVGVLSSLEDYDSVKKTVFLVSDAPVDASKLRYDGVQVVQVARNRVSECVGEFIV